ncbi:MAG: hypothetical protein J0L92_24035 [Deltaproteobacteria bacterium]|nr:hypothetical protein [Deltaproteobacteria bacterium]
MTLVAGIALYVLVGIAFGWRAWTRAAHQRGAASVGERFVSTLLATTLWPLWAPFVVERQRTLPVERGASAIGLEVRREIDAARMTCVQSGLDPVFSAEMAEHLRTEVERSVARVADLERTLATPHFDPGAAEAHVKALGGDTDRGRLASASLHARNVVRMRALLEADQQALRDLVELLRALRSQLALARFVGSSEADASGIVRDVWTRVEGLGAVIEQDTDLRAQDEVRG